MKKQVTGISFFQKYLSAWVLLCMVVGVGIGYYFPEIPKFMDGMNLSGISIPIAVLIWVMIYPMMMKVDFQSVKEIGEKSKCQPLKNIYGNLLYADKGGLSYVGFYSE